MLSVIILGVGLRCVVLLGIIVLSVVMQTVVNAECSFTVFPYAGGRNAEYNYV
jgi:hypothetical protein